MRFRLFERGLPNTAVKTRRYLHRAAKGELARALPMLIPWRLELGGVEHSFFLTLAKSAAPPNITLAELSVELFYPAQEATEAALRASH